MEDLTFTELLGLTQEYGETAEKLGEQVKIRDGATVKVDELTEWMKTVRARIEELAAESGEYDPYVFRYYNVMPKGLMTVSQWLDRHGSSADARKRQSIGGHVSKLWITQFKCKPSRAYQSSLKGPANIYPEDWLDGALTITE